MFAWQFSTRINIFFFWNFFFRKFFLEFFLKNFFSRYFFWKIFSLFFTKGNWFSKKISEKKFFEKKIIFFGEKTWTFFFGHFPVLSRHIIDRRIYFEVPSLGPYFFDPTCNPTTTDHDDPTPKRHPNDHKLNRFYPVFARFFRTAGSSDQKTKK